MKVNASKSFVQMNLRTFLCTCIYIIYLFKIEMLHMNIYTVTIMLQTVVASARGRYNRSDERSIVREGRVVLGDSIGTRPLDGRTLSSRRDRVLKGHAFRVSCVRVSCVRVSARVISECGGVFEGSRETNGVAISRRRRFDRETPGSLWNF